jgi:hypothetical protein
VEGQPWLSVMREGKRERSSQTLALRPLRRAVGVAALAPGPAACRLADPCTAGLLVTWPESECGRQLLVAGVGGDGTSVRQQRERARPLQPAARACRMWCSWVLVLAVRCGGVVAAVSI